MGDGFSDSDAHFEDRKSIHATGSICKCGHDAAMHHRKKSCTAIIDQVKLRYCKCEEFREVNSTIGDDGMPKAKKERTKKEKKVSAPKLAPFVDSPVKVYLAMGEKEREATILSTGTIKFKDVEYNSPCAAATAMAKDMGEKWKLNAWSAMKINKDGERVSLDTIRGAKSPLKKSEPKKAKSSTKKKKATPETAAA